LAARERLPLEYECATGKDRISTDEDGGAIEGPPYYAMEVTPHS